MAEPTLCAAVPRLPARPPWCRCAYARLKRALAERLGGDLATYTEIKDPACDLIVAAAEDWASTGRQHDD